MLNKELPNAPEVENSLISTLLTVPNSIYICLQLLNEDCFYQTRNRLLWNEIVQMHKEETEINVVSVVQRIADKKQFEQVGSVQHIMDITTRYFTHDPSGHSKILYQKYMRRNAIQQANRLIKDAYNNSNDIFNVLNHRKSTLFDCLSPSVSRTVDAGSAILKQLSDINANLGSYQEVTGVPSGFMNVDKRTGGFMEGGLYIVGGRPSMGKTTFVLNAAWNAFQHFDKSGIFFSCEMSKKQIMNLIIAKETGISAQKIRKNQLKGMDVEHMMHVFNNMKSKKNKFLIDDTPNAQIDYILAEATIAKQKHDIDFVVVDYLQLIRSNSNKSRHLQVSEISRELKALARNLDIPVIALAQLSRSVENREDKRPRLSDLKESGDIEQDADAVCFLYRPEYYGITEDEHGDSLEGITELVWRKNRHGEIGIDLLTMDKENSCFSMIDSDGYARSVDDYDNRLIEPQRIEQETNFNQKIKENENQEPFW